VIGKDSPFSYSGSHCNGGGVCVCTRAKIDISGDEKKWMEGGIKQNPSRDVYRPAILQSLFVLQKRQEMYLLMSFWLGKSR
jgi:hypothetical protein